MAETGKSSLKRSKPNYIYSIVGVALVLVIMGVMGWMLLNFSKVGNAFKEDIRMSAYLRTQNKDTIAQIQQFITSQPFAKDVKYIDDKVENGSMITIQNLEKMVMPVTVVVKEANGQQHRINLPVEVWQRGPNWTFAVQTTSEVKEVILDPDKKLPDFNRANNSWKKAF